MHIKTENFIKKNKYLKLCTEGGIRTHTLKKNRILNPACLPISPPRRIYA